MMRAKAEIEAQSMRCFARPFDLRSQESVRAFHEAALAALKPVHIPVNAEGVCAQKLFATTEFVKTIQPSLNNSWYMVRGRHDFSQIRLSNRAAVLYPIEVAVVWAPRTQFAERTPRIRINAIGLGHTTQSPSSLLFPPTGRDWRFVGRACD
jgi:hypothetical protein